MAHANGSCHHIYAVTESVTATPSGLKNIISKWKLFIIPGKSIEDECISGNISLIIYFLMWLFLSDMTDIQKQHKK